MKGSEQRLEPTCFAPVSFVDTWSTGSANPSQPQPRIHTGHLGAAVGPEKMRAVRFQERVPGGGKTPGCLDFGNAQGSPEARRSTLQVGEVRKAQLASGGLVNSAGGKDSLTSRGRGS